MLRKALITVVAVLGLCTITRAGVAVADWRAVKPTAIVDLRTAAGAELVHGTWRVHASEIIDVDHHAPGPDLKPTGPANRTHDLVPHAGTADFDDSAWEKVAATSLEQRRGDGRFSFVWYRINITIPDKLGDFVTTGSTAVFEITLDDYSEIHVNGKLPQVLGQTSGTISGWNAPNRVVLTRNAKAGERFQLAILGANAPLSEPPGNYIWIRSTVVKFFAPGSFNTPEPAAMTITRYDDAIDSIIAPEAKAEKVATGFGFTEGPVWLDDALLFSDPNNNSIYRYDPLDGGLSIYRANSGYNGIDIGRYHQPGSNGLAVDPQGRLTINEHGNRRVTRLEKNGTLTVLADRFEGKRLNSPNDLVYKSDGSLYFTDPPYGLPQVFDDPAKKLPYSGVFRWKEGEPLKLVAKDVIGPNGIAFSPDEKYLYVTNWDEKHKSVTRYDVNAADGTLSNGRVFADVTNEPGEEALDGMKIDRAGNVFFSGPGGVWIFNAAGKRIARLTLDQLPANMAWGDADGKTLYFTARTGVYRIRTLTGGVRSGEPVAVTERR